MSPPLYHLATPPRPRGYRRPGEPGNRRGYDDSGRACWPTASRQRMEPTRPDIEHEAMDPIGLDPRMGAQTVHRSEDARLEVVERPEIDREVVARFRRQLAMHRRLVRSEKAAARMADDDDLVGTKERLTDDQRADDVVGCDAAGISDDVRIAGSEAERLLDVQPRVHARDDRDPAQRRGGQRGPIERLRVALVLGQDPVELGAVAHPFEIRSRDRTTA